MSQKIHCKHCNKFMGELRDASIRNGMVVYCKECDSAIQLQLVGKSKSVPSDFGEIFGDIFGAGSFGSKSYK